MTNEPFAALDHGRLGAPRRRTVSPVRVRRGVIAALAASALVLPACTPVDLADAIRPALEGAGVGGPERLAVERVDVCAWAEREIEWSGLSYDLTVHAPSWSFGSTSDATWDLGGGVVESHCDLGEARLSFIRQDGLVVEPLVTGVAPGATHWIDQIRARGFGNVRVEPGAMTVQLDDAHALRLASQPYAFSTTEFDSSIWTQSELMFRLLDAWEQERLPTIARTPAHIIDLDREGMCEAVGLVDADLTGLLDDVPLVMTAGLPIELDERSNAEFLCRIEPAGEFDLFGENEVDSWKGLSVLLTWAPSEEEARLPEPEGEPDCIEQGPDDLVLACTAYGVMTVHTTGRWVVLVNLQDLAAGHDELAAPAAEETQTRVAAIGAAVRDAVADITPVPRWVNGGPGEHAVPLLSDPRYREAEGTDDVAPIGLECEAGRPTFALRTDRFAGQVCVEGARADELIFHLVGELDGESFVAHEGFAQGFHRWRFTASDDGFFADDPLGDEYAFIDIAVGTEGVTIAREIYREYAYQLMREYPDETYASAPFEGR